ncbi:uncharacterized protein LOC108278243 isoform X2 [Ictalurus punctatus]|uniref:Uncharacterized protein LOC108278243 isoform X2 n=1 Tax=Ictalurus punctatus TaxID=7998 RepID=A0A2D0SXA5_ICTPU|nr:uncharacterized protein LOC108278243 isoform X2 [Ictalurus punctatus]
MSVELYELKLPINNNDEVERMTEPYPGNGSCSNHNIPNATEESQLLSDIQPGTLNRLKTELNESVCRNLKVWMLLLIGFSLIILVIFLPIYFCAVNQEDMDDKYSVTEFVVPRFFNGNFTLLNKNVTLDEQSQSNLTQMLTHIYRSSYALGRYFSIAKVNALRSSSSSVEYKLTFKMPEEHKQIIRYTLSKEMVYHVLLQQLYDQDAGDSLYIEPTSLTMEVGS